MEKKKTSKMWLCVQFCAGGAGYGLLEILYRGVTHISMLFLGGACFCMLCKLAQAPLHLLQKSLMGGGIITALEYLTGCVVNLWLGLDVWDYSEEIFQLQGQICIRFFALWCGLSAAFFILRGYVRSKNRHRPVSFLPALWQRE